MAEGDDMAGGVLEAADRPFLALIAASREGDAAARTALYEAVHQDMTRIARALLRREQGPVSLSTGDVVGESMLRLLQSPITEAESRAHFLSIVATVMRRVLVDAARRRRAGKREGMAVTLHTSGPGLADREIDLLALDAALTRLGVVSPDLAEIVSLRYFVGIPLEEIAAMRGVSLSTAKRSWEVARAWLRDALHDG